MYATNRQSRCQTDVRRASSLNAPALEGGGIINMIISRVVFVDKVSEGDEIE